MTNLNNYDILNIMFYIHLYCNSYIQLHTINILYFCLLNYEKYKPKCGLLEIHILTYMS